MHERNITDAISGALTMARETPRTPRATITEERIQFLRKLFPRETGLAEYAHRWRSALTDQDIYRAAQRIRSYIPPALNLLWIAQDARKSRSARRAFNPIRLTVAA